jgi:hypothetical protein
MKNKHLICYLLCLTVVLSLCACTGETSNPQIPQDTTAQSTSKESSTPGNNHSVPPDIVYFQSLTGVRDFFTQVGTDQIEPTLGPSVRSIYLYKEASTAAQYSDAIFSLYIPVDNTHTDDDNFGSSYLPNNNSLDIIYIANNIQYCFIYFFDLDSDWYYGETPVFSDVSVGPYMIDFYQLENKNGKPYFLGHIAINGIDLLIRVMGIEGSIVESFSFDIFNFVPFSSIGGNVTA